MIKKLLLLATALFSINALATPVNINTADAKTIADSLNGIGIKKAEEIVNYRTKNGAFKTLEDLGKVKGIGDKTIAKNKADILLDDATPAPTNEPSTSTPETATTPATKNVKKNK